MRLMGILKLGFLSSGIWTFQYRKLFSVVSIVFNLELLGVLVDVVISRCTVDFIQALKFLSSRSSESDKSYKKRMRQKGRRNVKPGIFSDRPPASINFNFFQNANRSIF